MTQTTVRLDDLADPRLPAEVAALQQHLAGQADLASIDADRLMLQAADETGLDDFGDPWFREPLGVLCRSLREEAALSPLGIVGQRQQILDLLIGRLRVVDLVARHPEIRDVPIEAPIVVAGLPRSGTSFLHGLLAADPSLRFLTYAEAVAPTGPSQETTGGGGRLGKVVAEAMPHLNRMLEVTPNGAHEEIRLLAFSFASILFETQLTLPSYRDWYLAADQRPAYEFLKTTLQVAQWLRGGERWVLKAMQHVEQFPALAATFPDATVVVTHRDPAAITASLGTMLSYSQRLNVTQVDPHAVGRYWADRVAVMVERLSAYRDRLPATSVDVRLAEIAKDPLAVAERVYRTAGRPLSDAARSAMVDLDTGRHPHRNGRVSYSLADLGLDPAVLRAANPGYLDRFSVPIEDVS